nr:hypothetical protein TQ38_11500 [Novosphingobium sp. P6W]
MAYGMDITFLVKSIIVTRMPFDHEALKVWENCHLFAAARAFCGTRFFHFGERDRRRGNKSGGLIAADSSLPQV